jgi:hypothetical protein
VADAISVNIIKNKINTLKKQLIKNKLLWLKKSFSFMENLIKYLVNL